MKSSRLTKSFKREKDGAFHWRGHTTENFENTADIVTEEALLWLDNKDNRPFFMMVHYFDPHRDYAPPKRFKGAFSHPYSGEVAFTDEQLGRLITKLNALDLTDETLVVFTADHGECLGEYSRFYHHDQLFEAAIHVPFVLCFPGNLPENKRITGRYRTVDIMPTILELTGIPLPHTVEGESLVPTIQNSFTEVRPCYFETLYGKLETSRGISRQGITYEDWKFIRNRKEDSETGKVRENYQLYNLARDPLELKNLSARLPKRLESSHTLFNKFLATHPVGRATPIAPDKATIEKLKSLGYL